MGVAITLKEYLSEHGANFETIQHSRTASTLESAQMAHVPGDRMIKSVLLGDDQSYVMALIPATHRLELGRINDLYHRNLRLITEDELASAFSDCEIGAVPPLGDAYGIETCVDPTLLEMPEVFFESGDHEVLIRMDGEKFKQLLGETIAARVSHHL